MKKYILSILAFMLFAGANAQNKYLLKVGSSGYTTAQIDSLNALNLKQLDTAYTGNGKVLSQWKAGQLFQQKENQRLSTGDNVVHNNLILNATDNNIFLANQDLNFINNPIGNSIKIQGTNDSTQAFFQFGNSVKLFGWNGTKLIFGTNNIIIQNVLNDSLTAIRALIASIPSTDTTTIASKAYVTNALSYYPTNTSLASTLTGYVPTTRTINGYALSSNIILAKSDVGLANVDNTSDINKPISTATETAFNLKLNTSQGTLQGITGLGSSTTNTLVLKSVPFIIKIPTIQGDTATTSPYGNFYHTLDQSYINPDGQRDAVMQWGYNQNGGGSSVKTNEGAFHLAIESHYQPYPSAQPQFEFHIQSRTIDGVINRNLSINPNKITGYTTTFMQTDAFDLRGTQVNGNNTYFSSGTNGITAIQGSNARLDIVNSTVNANTGTLRLIPELDGNATVLNTGNGDFVFYTSKQHNFYYRDSIGDVMAVRRNGGFDFNTNQVKVKSGTNFSQFFYSGNSTDATIAITGNGGDNGGNYAAIGNSAATLYFDSRGGIAPYRFFVGGTDAIDIFPSGNIGMGTNNAEDASAKLKIVGNIKTIKPIGGTSTDGGAFKIGQIITGTGGMKYLEIEIDGTKYYLLSAITLP